MLQVERGVCECAGGMWFMFEQAVHHQASLAMGAF